MTPALTGDDEMADQWGQEEEEQARECQLNGHRDTGRGVCADCGEFIGAVPPAVK